MIADRTRITMHPGDFMALACLCIFGEQEYRALKATLDLAAPAFGSLMRRLEFSGHIRYRITTKAYHATQQGKDLFKNRAERLEIKEK